jgi:hypothetical protein
MRTYQLLGWLLLLLVAATPLQTAKADPLAPTHAQQPLAHSVYLPAIGNAIVAANTVSVVSARGFQEGSKYHVFAEIRSSRSEATCGTRVTAKFFNGTGAIVATDSGWPMLEMLSPGQSAPVHLSITVPEGGVARYSLAVTGAYRCFSSYWDVGVLTHDVFDVSGLQIHGEVQNGTETTLASVTAVATFYDETGGIWYAAEGALEGWVNLEPGDRSVYAIRTGQTDLFDKRFVVQAQGTALPWQR